jgi:L-fuculose-phosphate aldolase
LGNLKLNDFVFLSSEGEVREGKKPSMETPLHLEIYKKRSDVNAIIHTHSPYSVIMGLKSSQLDFSSVFVEGKFETGKVPFLPSGSEELSRETARVLLQKDVALLEKHGVVTVGRDPFEALYLAETIEHLSKLIYLLQIWEK